MGGDVAGINLSGTKVILMSGLQGSGKTTFSGKLANYLQTKRLKPLLVACYRPVSNSAIVRCGRFDRVGYIRTRNESS
jgi:signal recognition particle subunit SRP54